MKSNPTSTSKFYPSTGTFVLRRLHGRNCIRNVIGQKSVRVKRGASFLFILHHLQSIKFMLSQNVKLSRQKINFFSCSLAAGITWFWKEPNSQERLLMATQSAACCVHISFSRLSARASDLRDNERYIGPETRFRSRFCCRFSLRPARVFSRCSFRARLSFLPSTAFFKCAPGPSSNSWPMSVV